MTKDEAAFITGRARTLQMSREKYIRETLLRRGSQLHGKTSDERLLIVIADHIDAISREIYSIGQRVAEDVFTKEDRLALKEKLTQICNLFSETKVRSLETLQAPE